MTTFQPTTLIGPQSKHAPEAYSSGPINKDHEIDQVLKYLEQFDQCKRVLIHYNKRFDQVERAKSEIGQ